MESERTPRGRLSWREKTEREKASDFSREHAASTWTLPNRAVRRPTCCFFGKGTKKGEREDKRNTLFAKSDREKEKRYAEGTRENSRAPEFSAEHFIAVESCALTDFSRHFGERRKQKRSERDKGLAVEIQLTRFAVYRGRISCNFHARSTRTRQALLLFREESIDPRSVGRRNKRRR